jgi:hypothetical protein
MPLGYAEPMVSVDSPLFLSDIFHSDDHAGEKRFAFY